MAISLFVRFRFLGILLLAVCLSSLARAQTATNAPQSSGTSAASAQDQPAAASQKPADPPDPLLSPQSQYGEAEQQMKQEEHQRILGIIPNFNTSDISNAAPLSPGQKFSLALKSSVDPFEFAFAAADAGYSQWVNDFPGYGQGAQGYFKRFGASYADTFDGAMWGNVIFPIMLRQDPRYFRKGTGSIKRRFLYALLTTVWAKNDNGSWGPNYSNVLGNIAAGGISNLYYPASDRGAWLTFQRAFTVTAEGAIGSVFVEFWPDISRKVFGKSRPSPQQPGQN